MTYEEMIAEAPQHLNPMGFQLDEKDTYSGWVRYSFSNQLIYIYDNDYTIIDFCILGASEFENIVLEVEYKHDSEFTWENFIAQVKAIKLKYLLLGDQYFFMET